MRIIFMGTPDFAVPSLRALAGSGHDVVAVVTQPDRPKGRGNKLTPPPVKELAESLGIPVLQPVKVRTQDFPETLRAFSPELFVTAAYGRILTEEVLSVPFHGCINVHGSLLPKYRGAAPIQWSVINGDAVTGVTTMMTDIGMDTGDILMKSEFQIPENMTTGELYPVLADIGADLLIKTLDSLEAGTLRRYPQNASEATHAPMLSKDDGIIRWEGSARKIHNQVRGMDPWPGAATTLCGERLRIWRAVVLDDSALAGQAGTVLNAGPEGIDVACGQGILRILEVQKDSAKRMAAGPYLAGNSMPQTAVLGVEK